MHEIRIYPFDSLLFVLQDTIKILDKTHTQIHIHMRLMRRIGECTTFNAFGERVRAKQSSWASHPTLSSLFLYILFYYFVWNVNFVFFFFAFRIEEKFRAQTLAGWRLLTICITNWNEQTEIVGIAHTHTYYYPDCADCADFAWMESKEIKHKNAYTHTHQPDEGAEENLKMYLPRWAGVSNAIE